MITDCPNCHRQFRINATQLSAANGVVQCGFCGEQYNSLERLHDRPLLNSEIEEPDYIVEDDEEVTESEILEEPQFEIPKIQPEETNDNVISRELLSTMARRITVTTIANNQQPIESSIGIEGDELAMELFEQSEKKQSNFGTILWTSGTMVLVFVILVQITWFNRDWILNRVVQYRPIARQFCEKYGCEMTRERDLSAIVLINRDVRDHPRYTEALLVNATIENQSEFIQPYPVIRLTLFGTEGNITGYRTFNPADYLDESINMEFGMPVSVPVHLVLEITGATDAAVSFEFNFI